MSDDESRDQRPKDGSVGDSSLVLRPAFLGNLHVSYKSEDVIAIFETPQQPRNATVTYKHMPVDRIDVKRGYCFVFLKDALNQEEKELAERYISDINGMEVPGVSNALRVEFARGDGRVKRKEDERREKIEPSDTLFVVNFNEKTTDRNDLVYLFQPFGRLLRIDMKRNYAFVQFEGIEQATKAKESTDGGKFDKSILTVEYVARQRENDRGRDRRDGPQRGRRDRHGDFNRGGPPSMRNLDRGDRRYDRGGPPPPPMRGGGSGRGYDDHRIRGRDRSPIGGYRGGVGIMGARRSRSRSPSPPRYGGGYRGRSPPRRYGERFDNLRRGDGNDMRRPPSPRGLPPMRRGDSPLGRRSPDRDIYRGDRGYRS